jgi:hypothetical protein
MLKKSIAILSLIVLAGCQSGVEIAYTDLTDQVSGCVREVLDQKGGSVIIKSPAQYYNFQSEINKLGELSEHCSNEVVLPEIDFAEEVFVAKNVINTCTLKSVIETSLEEGVLMVSFLEDTSEFEGQDCENLVEGTSAASLKNLSEEVESIIIVE